MSYELSHSETFLKALKSLAGGFYLNSHMCHEITAELHEFWAQIRAGQRWASANAMSDKNVARIACGYAWAAIGDLVPLSYGRSLRNTWFEDAIPAATYLQDWEMVARLQLLTAQDLIFDKKFAEAEPLLASAANYFEYHPEGEHLVSLLSTLGDCALFTGDGTLARQHFQRGATIAHRNGFHGKRLAILKRMIQSLLSDGIQKPIRDLIFQVFESAHSSDRTLDLVEAIVFANEVAGAICDSEFQREMRELCCKLIGTLAPDELPFDHSMFHSRLIEILDQHDSQKAREFANASALAARESGSIFGEGMVRTLLAFLHFSDGNLEDACRECRDSVNLLVRADRESEADIARKTLEVILKLAGD